jgi:hypothetical protein
MSALDQFSSDRLTCIYPSGGGDLEEVRILRRNPNISFFEDTTETISTVLLMETPDFETRLPEPDIKGLDYQPSLRIRYFGP